MFLNDYFTIFKDPPYSSHYNKCWRSKVQKNLIPVPSETVYYGRWPLCNLTASAHIPENCGMCNDGEDGEGLYKWAQEFLWHSLAPSEGDI